METMMEMSMEGALSVLSDPAVLALEGALFTAWALAEVRLQKKANQAKEYAALNGNIISDRTKELWAQQNAGQPGDGDGEKGSSYSSVASSFEALSLESMYGSLPSLPRVTLPQMPSFPNMPALPFNMPAWRGSSANQSDNMAVIMTHKDAGDVHMSPAQHFAVEESPELEFLNLTDTPSGEGATLHHEALRPTLVASSPPNCEGFPGLSDSAAVQKLHDGLRLESVAMATKTAGAVPTKQKRRPRTREQLERCRQESARARERKKAERTRLERTVAKRTEDCDRLRATLRALQAESGALRQALLEGTMFTLSQVPTMEPPAAKQAFATAQLCAHALQSPVLFAAMDPLDQSNKNNGTSLREIRPRPSSAMGEDAEAAH